MGGNEEEKEPAKVIDSACAPLCLCVLVPLTLAYSCQLKLTIVNRTKHTNTAHTKYSKYIHLNGCVICRACRFQYIRNYCRERKTHRHTLQRPNLGQSKINSSDVSNAVTTSNKMDFYKFMNGWRVHKKAYNTYV